MITKRIYPGLDSILHPNPKNDGFVKKVSPICVKGFVPKKYQKFQHFDLRLPITSTITNEEFITVIDNSINSIFDKYEMPSDYNQIVKFFQASSKLLDSQFIKNTISEILGKYSHKICTDFFQCETLKQLSKSWCEMCRKCHKVEFIIYFLPYNTDIIDFFCEKCKNLLDSPQKKSILDIIIRDFEKFDGEMINDMKEVFDFLSKLEIYSEDFFAHINSVALSYFKAINNEMDQVKLTDRFKSLEDAATFSVRFSSNLLNQSDIIKLTYDVNEEFAKILFEELEKELPNLFKFHQIQDIKIFFKSSISVNKLHQFIELLNFCFISYVKNAIESSSPDDLFQVLNDNALCLLELCNALGKNCKEILIPSFRKIINKNPNYIATVVAFGIDSVFTKHLEFEMSTILFIFKLLNAKDVFEAYHTNLLMKRIRQNNKESLLSDFTLAEEIRSYCGDYYAKRFDLLINGAEFSKKCFDSFCNEFQVPSIFNVFLVNSNLLTILSTSPIDQNEAEKIPAEVKILSAQYFGFLRDNFPNRRYNWCLKMTEVELKCINSNQIDDFEYFSEDYTNYYFIVHCNSYCASFILSFNDKKALTIQEIMEKTNLSENEIECILTTLTSPKVNLVYKDIDKYYINYCPKKSEIKIPSFNMINSAFLNEGNQEHILDNQIDCLIIKITKSQRKIDKNDLFQMIMNEIDGKVTEKKFKSRIDDLKRKSLISENELGTISYIP